MFCQKNLAKPQVQKPEIDLSVHTIDLVKNWNILKGYCTQIRHALVFGNHRLHRNPFCSSFQRRNMNDLAQLDLLGQPFLESSAGGK